MLELENRDEVSAGCNENWLKHKLTETTGVVSGHKKSVGAASRSDWEMENEKLKVELKYLRLKKKHLLKQKDKLEDIVSSSIYLMSLGIKPIPKLEPHLLGERTKQLCDFEERVEDLKITWSNTLDGVLEMIKPIKEEYPLLESNDIRDIVRMHLVRLRHLEEVRIKDRYLQLMLENIATVGDISRMNYDDFKDAVINNKPNFSDEDFESLFESVREYVMERIYFVMADKVQGKNLEEEPITEDMKKTLSDP
ncbi:hypothetical protein QJS10_CPA16g00206 [Acorus calamus]|uniref:Uncharacterized protein n=1 Tax=Acorus calamus TaxID=4465 RepID=A0AAV9D144_ACOCL|nr:hypothetical protein QJS10_CPA16g00206 [Acorus calamus]